MFINIDQQLMVMSIPSGIIDFLDDEHGKTLLIKGEPGTGKSILALTILKEACAKGSGVYLSTRVDPETLYLLFPWVHEAIPAENIVDATMSIHPLKKEMGFKPLKYTEVPDFLKEVYTRTESLDKPIVVIDSWDAVVSHTGHYRAEDRERLEHNMCDFSRKTKTKIIFVVEYTEQRPLDYLADGVVVVQKKMIDERRVRELIIAKLRGVSIKKSAYLYTLDSGRFKYFEDFFAPKNVLSIPEIIPDLNEGISTGIKDLDRISGGYKRSGLNLLVFSREVLSGYHFLIYPGLINFLNQGGIVFTVEGTRNLKDELSPYLSENVRGNIKDEKEFLIREGGKSSLWFLNLDRVKKEKIEEIIESRRGDIFLGVVRVTKSLDLENMDIISTCIKIKKISGAFCLYGNLPRTEMYGVELNENPRIKLVPIL